MIGARVVVLGCAIRRVVALAGGLAALLLVRPVSAWAQRAAGCVTTADADSAWAAFRAQRLDEARRRFATATARCPTDAGARVGLAYVALRAGELRTARAGFDAALRLAPENYDALTGRGMLAWREGDLAAVRAAFQSALRVVPGDSLSLAYLARLPAMVDSTPLPVRRRPSTTIVAARTASRRFEVPDGRSGWRPFTLKAVNLGAALPGKYPSEFPPDDSTYERWIATIAAMKANAVRVYTVHPPYFYRALARWNAAHPGDPLWLVHGVWTEPPPGTLEDGYDDPAWHRAFMAEMNDVVNLVHGRAIIPPRPGHAGGRYIHDVSRWTVAWILGREWEPYSVVAYNARRPGVADWSGRFIRVSRGHALERWMAQAADSTIGYEMARFNAQRPIAYTNWPTLDPLTHPSEATQAEERALLAMRGEELPEPSKEFDNDAVGLDARRMTGTDAFPAGTFASYHAYPYYPDFIQLDTAYAASRSSEGPSSYMGYLRALVAHHGDMPVVIAEYGVPSSRGVAHLEPQGWHHGGHDEAAQARINARLTREIIEAGCAGLAIFALIDEWFKYNWAVIDFERPGDRNRLWYNALDAEQNYGIIAMRPGVRDSVVQLDGRGDDWSTEPWLSRSALDTNRSPLALKALRVQQDEGYLYLRLDVGAIDWTRGRYLIGIDTYRRDLGDVVLPVTRERVSTGLEFVLDLRGADSAQLLVDAPYNPRHPAPVKGALRPTSIHVYQRPFETRANDAGRWEELFVPSNRRRIGRDGTVYPERGTNWSTLRFGTSASSTLADWYADSTTGIIEVRLPWGLLNVIDPSARTVLFGMDADGSPAAMPTDGFRFLVRSYDPRTPTLPGDALPLRGTPLATWSWRPWETPRWYAERKPQFDALRAVFESLP